MSRKLFVILVAVVLVGAGLLLERRSASASSAPQVVQTGNRQSATVTGPLEPLNAAASQLRGAASLLRQTLPGLDTDGAARTADLAASASQAAGLSQQLAAATTGKAPVAAAQANAMAGKLQSALATTQAKAAAVNSLPAAAPVQFCNFTIQIGPIIIDIPRLHIHIVIGPFFIHFRAPCFLSGIIPTHVPPPTTTTTSTPGCAVANNALVANAAPKCTQKKFPLVPPATRFDVVGKCIILVGANLTSGACDPVTTMAGVDFVQVACTGTGPVSGTLEVTHAGTTVTTSTWAGRC